jgi:hypothetical protein
LHRPPNYSPSEDSSVRTRAYELRQKLEKLYAEELPTETVRIVIPKGAYTPQFIRNSGLVQTFSMEVKPSIPKESPAPIEKRRRIPTAFILIALIAAAVGYLAGIKSQKRTAVGTILEPIVQEAWKQFAKPNENVLLVAATPLYLVLGPETHQAYKSSIYPAPSEAYPLFREHRPFSSKRPARNDFHKGCIRRRQYGRRCNRIQHHQSVGSEFPNTAGTCCDDVSAPRPRFNLIWGASRQPSDF